MATTSNVTKTGTTTGSPVAGPDTAAIARDAAQIRAQDRSRLATDKIVNLDNIDGAQASIVQANKNIQNNNQSIQAQRDSQAENLAAQEEAQAIIEQNNITLANPNLPSSSRAALEANNALNRAVIAESAVNIAQAENNINNAIVNIELQQASIQTNQAVIIENADAFQARGGLTSDITVFEDGTQAVIFDQGDGVPEFSPTPVDPDLAALELEKQQALDASVVESLSPAPVDDGSDALRAAALEADQTVADINQEVDDADPFEAARLRAIAESENEEPISFGPEDVDPLSDEQLAQLEEDQVTNRQLLQSEDALDAASQAATIAKAKQQATLQARYKQPGNNDWRVRLVLAEGADYLYKANPPGILKPLADSNGVIFPYTPEIQTTYSANYEQYDLVHSNYRGYFYKNSRVGDINLTANFTAQDTAEAQYMLAVIHFFRSVTKMFYGKDAQRGAPPPLVYLIGLGDFQFNGHPCLVSNFQYTMPSDVDYIRANNPNNYGTNMINRVSKSTTATSPAASVLNRLSNAIDNFGRSLQPGAIPTLPAFGSVLGSVNNTNRSTYVPTKMQISITLLPVQTRSQVSQQFSLKSFANGDLLKGGFW